MSDDMLSPQSLSIELPRRDRITAISGAVIRRPIVLVLGMHRSGTSLCSHLLSALGVDMADDIGVNVGNDGGHWERWEIVEFHDRILHLFNRDFYSDPQARTLGRFHDFALPVAWWADPRVTQIRREIVTFLDQRMGDGYFGFKDPRAVRLMPVWHQIFNEVKLAPKIVLCLRNPAQVARSLYARDKLDPAVGEYRWLVYLVDFFRYANSYDFCTVEYEGWFDNPSANLEKLRKFLDLPWQQSEADLALVLSDVVDPALRHDDADHREANQPLVRSLHELASRADRDGEARDQIAYIVSQFVGFQQLQRPFQRAFEEVAKVAAKFPEAEQEAVALRAPVDEREAVVETTNARTAAIEGRLADALAADAAPRNRPDPSSNIAAGDDPSSPTMRRELDQVRYDVHGAIRYFTKPGPEFEEHDPSILQDRSYDAKLIAFYLPQFHPIPENDEWWGVGFTEWRNVARGVPRFVGHYQPRIPRDLAHYDLRVPEVLRKQAKMAGESGIYGFCFYFYWFNGKRLLEGPLDAFARDDTIELPFCILWANENWTRRWDGLESEVLIRQDYRVEDESALIDAFHEYMSNARYIRIEGKPILGIYRADQIPDPVQTLQRWRELFMTRFGYAPIIIMCQCFGCSDPRQFGFDGAVEFPPHKILQDSAPVHNGLSALDPKFVGHVFDYEDAVRRSLAEPPQPFPLIKCVFPSWDNDARRQEMSMVVHNSTPAKYQRWLQGALEIARNRPVFGEALVFINAWNEWAEAAYLEPDLYYGAAYLNATARALTAQIAEAGRELRTARADAAVREAVLVQVQQISHERTVAAAVMQAEVATLQALARAEQERANAAEAAQAELKTLRDALAQAEETAREHAGAVETVQAEVARLRDALAQAERDVLERGAAAEAMQAEVTALWDSLGQLQEEAQQREAAAAVMQGEVAELRGTLARAEREARQYSAAVSASEPELRSLREKSAQANREATEHRKAVAASRAEIATLQSETAALQDKLTAARQVGQAAIAAFRLDIAAPAKPDRPRGWRRGVMRCFGARSSF
jgi:predicted  nucleic acid-binding Zn-ribbon protein